MIGDNKIMLALLVIALFTLFVYSVAYAIAERKRSEKRAQARYKAYRITRRATAEQYAKQLQLAYLTILYGGNK